MRRLHLLLGFHTNVRFGVFWEVSEVGDFLIERFNSRGDFFGGVWRPDFEISEFVELLYWVLKDRCLGLWLVANALLLLFLVAAASPGLCSFHFELCLLSHNRDKVGVCGWRGSGFGFLSGGLCGCGLWEVPIQV
jgi:hypothetical protein